MLCFSSYKGLQNWDDSKKSEFEKGKNQGKQCRESCILYSFWNEELEAVACHKWLNVVLFEHQSNTYWEARPGKVMENIRQRKALMKRAEKERCHTVQKWMCHSASSVTAAFSNYFILFCIIDFCYHFLFTSLTQSQTAWANGLQPIHQHTSSNLCIQVDTDCSCVWFFSAVHWALYCSLILTAIYPTVASYPRSPCCRVADTQGTELWLSLEYHWTCWNHSQEQLPKASERNITFGAYKQFRC